MLRPSEHPSERWGTPPEIKRPLLAEFAFDLDAAGDADLHVVDRYLTCDDNALSGKEWPGQVVFCNPPYGRKLEPFVREMARQARDYGKLVVGLIPFRCRAAWWHEAVIGRASEVRCVRKRVRFVRPDGTRGKFTGSCDSCIVVWRSAQAITTLTAFDQTYPRTNQMSGQIDNTEKWAKALDSLWSNPVTLGISVIYDSKMFGLPRFGIAGNGSRMEGWLVVENANGNWMSLADLRPHFIQPPPTDPERICAEYARRIAQLEIELSQAKARLAAVGFGASK